MLKQWICATTGKVVFTPKGRAYNIRAPTLGSTANAALLSVLYGQTRSPYIPQAKADRYTCFARSQVRGPIAPTMSDHTLATGACRAFKVAIGDIARLTMATRFFLMW